MIRITAGEVEHQAGDRDRVRRQPRLDQPVARVAAPLGRRPRLWASALDGRTLLRLRGQACLGLGAGDHDQAAGRRRASCRAATAATPATRRPGDGVEPEVVAGGDDHEEDEQRIDGPQGPRDRACATGSRGDPDHQREGDVHARHGRVLVEQQARRLRVLGDAGERRDRVGEARRREEAAAAPSGRARSRPGRGPSRPGTCCARSRSARCGTGRARRGSRW